MSQKKCPLGFVLRSKPGSVYENVAAPDCIEAECQWWDERYRDCCVKLGMMSNVMLAGMPVPYREGQVPYL